MEKTMKFSKVFAITVAIVFCMGLQSGYADENAPLFDVTSDGIMVEVTELEGEQKTDPIASVEMTEDELIEAGVDVTPLTEADLAELDALPAVTSGIEGEETEVRIGYDGRMRVYPAYSSINKRAGLLTISGAGRCSAWCIGPRAVATAGHCVSSSRGRWYSGWRYYPAHSTGFGSASHRRAITNSTYFNTRNEQYDYAVVQFWSAICNSTGSYGYHTGNPSNRPMVVPGYPGDKSSSQQWIGPDKVRTYTSRQIFYSADTAGGMSGSAVTENSRSSSGPYSIGIHAYGRHGSWPHSTYNHGTRMASHVKRFLDAFNTR